MSGKTGSQKLLIVSTLPENLQPAAQMGGRLNRSFGPIAAGILLDLMDFATFGPIGLILGLPIGAATGWWMASVLGVENKNRRWFALAAALYCTIPFTAVVPLATLTGAYVRFKQSGSEHLSSPEEPASE